MWWVVFQALLWENNSGCVLVCQCAESNMQEDYRRTVSEIDEKEYISLKIIVSELRNQYVSIDLILFNPHPHKLQWNMVKVD